MTMFSGRMPLFAENGMPVQAKLVPEGAVVEINTYEQLRELDENSDQLTVGCDGRNRTGAFGFPVRRLRELRS